MFSSNLPEPGQASEINESQLEIEEKIKSKTSGFDAYEIMSELGNINYSDNIETFEVDYDKKNWTYTGQFKSDNCNNYIMHGFGKRKTKDGKTEYTGFHYNGFPVSYGIEHHIDSDLVIKGENYSELEGYGYIKSKSDYTYEGSISKLLQNGIGESIWNKKSRYIGGNKNSFRENYGSYYYDGDLSGHGYSGEWKNNKFHGYVRFYFMIFLNNKIN